METMKMIRGWVVLMFLMAAIALCNNRQVVAEDATTYTLPRASLPSCSNGDKAKINKCMTNTTSLDKCCPIFKNTIGTTCKCYRYAKDLDYQALITLESYCDISNPCKRAQKVVEVDTISATPQPRPRPQPKCTAAEEAKVKTCMTKTASLDSCCPTFSSILGRSCPCYAYAYKLDYQALITLQAYCDVSNPCKQVQEI